MDNKIILSLASNLSFFFMLIYFLFKIRVVKDVLVARSSSSGGYIVVGALTVLFSVLDILTSVFGIKVGTCVVNLRTGIVVISSAFLGAVPGIIVGLAGGIYRYTLGGLTVMGCSASTLSSGFACAFLVYFLRKKYGKVELTIKNSLIFAAFAGFWEVFHTIVLVPILASKPFMEIFMLTFSKFLLPLVIFNSLITAVVLILIYDIGNQETVEKIQEDEALLLAKHDSNNKVIDNIDSILSAVSVQSEALKETMDETSNEVQQMSKVMEQLRTKLISQGGSITKTGETVQNSLDTLQKLEQSAVTQSGIVKDSSSLIEEMIANISGVTGMLEESNGTISRTHALTTQGKEVAKRANEIAAEIAKKSDDLLEAGEVIQRVASQTNLLAMNAAIEAAHAGESGAGFAVVADEIRKLAEESNVQGKKIALVIKDSLQEIANLIEAEKVTETTFSGVYAMVDEISLKESRILSAMQKQQSGSQKVIGAIDNMNRIAENIKNDAGRIFHNGTNTSSEMRNLKELTKEVAEKMHAMTSAMQSMNEAIHTVDDVIKKNVASIEEVVENVDKFQF